MVDIHRCCLGYTYGTCKANVNSTNIEVLLTQGEPQFELCWRSTNIGEAIAREREEEGERDIDIDTRVGRECPSPRGHLYWLNWNSVPSYDLKDEQSDAKSFVDQLSHTVAVRRCVSGAFRCMATCWVKTKDAGKAVELRELQSRVLGWIQTELLPGRIWSFTSPNLLLLRCDLLHEWTFGLFSDVDTIFRFERSIHNFPAAEATRQFLVTNV
jgi:hypothetical protein